MFKARVLSAKDSYKVGHIHQYVKGTELVYSAYTPRYAAYPKVNKDVYDGKIVVAGIQLLLKAYFQDFWNDTFFNVPREEAVKHYERRCSHLLNKNFNGDHFRDLWELGHLPLSISALEEGSLVPVGTPIMTWFNTIKDFYWLPNDIETAISFTLWPVIDAATNAYYMRKLIEKHIEEVHGDKSMIPFLGHDFAMRGEMGTSGPIQTGLGHLMSFAGTDNLLAIDASEDYYHADTGMNLIAGSVDATEHSVMTLMGPDGEFETFDRLITENDECILSLVSDGYDYWKVLTEYLPLLKDKVLNRKHKLVIRGDSGDPVDIITGEVFYLEPTLDFNECIEEILVEKVVDQYQYCYYRGKYYNFRDAGDSGYLKNNEGDLPFPVVDVKDLPAHVKGSFVILAEIFGTTLNEAGFKELHEKIGYIYGDGINPERATAICNRLRILGFASMSVLGMGSYFYQYTSRDGYSQAVKAMAGMVNGEMREIYKDPKTDSKKKSLRGLLKVVEKYGEIVTLDQQEGFGLSENNLLKEVMYEGKILRETSMSAIRKRLHNWNDSLA